MKIRIATTLVAALAAASVWAVPPVTECGMYSGVDLLFLSPKISNAGVASIFYYGDIPSTAEVGGAVDAPLEFAQRVFVGYQGDAGGGAQVRWFTFDNDLDYVGAWENGTPIDLVGTVNLDIDAIDAELTQRGSFHVWNWLASAGARYGRLALTENAINFEDVPAFVFGGLTGLKFEGAGPTLAAGGSREVLFEGLSIFANARTSLLFGDSELSSAFFDGSPLVIDNDFVQVWEFQIGTRLQAALTDNVDMFSGIFWEAQRWDSDNLVLGDVALHGFGAQFGFLY